MFQKYALLSLCLLFIFQASNAQVYVEKQTRHRFAQLNLGLDYYTGSGGLSGYLNSEGILTPLDLDTYSTPRILVGGTHFWGHADFVIGFPVSGKPYKKEGQEISFLSGVETMFKYYPWRIQNKRIVPYVGASLSGYSFRQSNESFVDQVGSNLVKSHFPLLGGLSFNYKNHLLELGVTYLTKSSNDYYISETVQTEVQVPKAFFNLSYRYLLDTTLAQERDWESGRTHELTSEYAALGKLNGFFFSAGPSSAFTLTRSSYNENDRPYTGSSEGELFFDFAMGYYWHKQDMNVSIIYRNYRTANDAFRSAQKTRRESTGLEFTKFLGDYHGFAPYIGPVLSFENLSFEERFDGEMLHDLKESKLGLGLTFGWDIRPTDLDTWLLRTNLRWYPKLDMDVSDGNQISFSTLEFNFIQLVVYPGRFRLKK